MEPIEANNTNQVVVPQVKQHPAYKRMVTLAIKSKDNAGASLQAIYKYLDEHWSIGKSGRRFIRVCLQKGLEKKLWYKRKATYRLLAAKPKAQRKQPKKVKPIPQNNNNMPQAQGTIVPKPKKRGAPKPKAPSSTQPKTTQSNPNLVWTWQFNDNGWCNYHPDASKVVEATYQEYLRNPGITDVRSVQSGEWHYLVDFRQMTQQNIQHENHTVRRIRRVSIPATDTEFRKRFAQ